MSVFGLLSGFGFRPSGFRVADLMVGMIGGILEQPLLEGSGSGPLALLSALDRAL